MHLLTKGDYTKLDEVTSWDLDKFLTLGESLLRRKIVENYE